MRTTIDVDRAAAAAAAKILKTASLKDTVNAALREVLGAQRRRSLAARIRARALPAPTPAELARLHRPRLPLGALNKLQ